MRFNNVIPIDEVEGWKIVAITNDPRITLCPNTVRKDNSGVVFSIEVSIKKFVAVEILGDGFIEAVDHDKLLRMLHIRNRRKIRFLDIPNFPRNKAVVIPIHGDASPFESAYTATVPFNTGDN